MIHIVIATAAVIIGVVSVVFGMIAGSDPEGRGGDMMNTCLTIASTCLFIVLADATHYLVT